jgi:hypothetical protein
MIVEWPYGSIEEKELRFIQVNRWCPEASLKSIRMELNFKASCVVGVPINIVSSTNWLWDVVGCKPCR